MPERIPARGALHYISKEKGVVLQAEDAIDSVPSINATANEGFYYANVLLHPERPVAIARGHIEPNGYVVTHDTRNHYIVTIVNGAGTVRVHRNDGVEEIRFTAGDVIVFPPAQTHEWCNGDTVLDFVGVELLEN